MLRISHTVIKSSQSANPLLGCVEVASSFLDQLVDAKVLDFMLQVGNECFIVDESRDRYTGKQLVPCKEHLFVNLRPYVRLDTFLDHSNYSDVVETLVCVSHRLTYF